MTPGRFPAGSLPGAHTVHMPRALAWIAAVALPLAACGAVTPPSSFPLRALEDCPSCGIMPTEPVPEALFWGWHPENSAAPEVWTYGEERQNGDVREVHISPSEQLSSQKKFSRPLGCLLEGGQPDALSEGPSASSTFHATDPIPFRQLTSQAGADALCANTFGAQWRAVARSSLDSAGAQGFWVAGHRPGDTGLEW